MLWRNINHTCIDLIWPWICFNQWLVLNLIKRMLNFYKLQLQNLVFCWYKIKNNEIIVTNSCCAVLVAVFDFQQTLLIHTELKILPGLCDNRILSSLIIKSFIILGMTEFSLTTSPKVTKVVICSLFKNIFLPRSKQLQSGETVGIFNSFVFVFKRDLDDMSDPLRYRLINKSEINTVINAILKDSLG